MKLSTKTAKTIKNNTRNKKSATKVIDQYSDLFTFRMRPVSEAFIERLASDLVKWSIKADDALKLCQFILNKGIHPKTFYSWAKKYPTLGMAKDVALAAIGNRREIGAIKNKYNASVVMSQMSKYDPSWWKLEVERAELRARTQQKSESDIRYTIVVDSYKEKDKTKTNNIPDEKETVKSQYMQASG